MCGGNSIDSIDPLKNCAKERLAVILVDMQQIFVSGIEKKERQRMISNQISVIRWCAKNDVPIIVLEYHGDGKTVDILSNELKIVASLTTIIKSHDDGFKDTNLADVLKKMNAKKLFFMGINAGACVMDTAQSAIVLGFEIITSDEVIASGGSVGYMPWYEKNGVVLPVKELQQAFF